MLQIFLYLWFAYIHLTPVYGVHVLGIDILRIAKFSAQRVAPAFDAEQRLIATVRRADTRERKLAAMIKEQMMPIQNKTLSQQQPRPVRASVRAVPAPRA
eukprot:6212180-Pleurochrysis_carterae.AAC.3